MADIGLENGAPLSIQVTIKDRCELVFQEGDGEPLVIESELSRDRLKSLCGPLRQVLKEFQGNFQALQPRPEREIGEALRRLHFGGRQILWTLFNDEEKLDKASQMCRKLCPNIGKRGWKPGWDPSSFVPRTIEVFTSVDYWLPIDLLPLLNPDKPEAAETLYDVARIAATFLGFSTIVKRTFPDSLPANRRMYVENQGSLPVKMFWDQGLPGAKSNKQFFDEHSAYFDLKGGPWPNGTESDANFYEQLAEYLVDPETSFDRESGHRADELSYFYCHCDTTAENADDYVLYLACERRLAGLSLPSHSHSVQLRHLRDELRLRNRRMMQTGRATGRRPLVFLNACGSASLDPAAITSFPKLFLSKNMGFLGFIGTETTIPDAFGRVFAEVFYRNFVGGLSLGRSLHAARWYMLRHKSPLGILYTLFADPEIRVRNMVESLRPKWPLD
jgi:hypothetical protein